MKERKRQLIHHQLASLGKPLSGFQTRTGPASNLYWLQADRFSKYKKIVFLSAQAWTRYRTTLPNLTKAMHVSSERALRVCCAEPTTNTTHQKSRNYFPRLTLRHAELGTDNARRLSMRSASREPSKAASALGGGPDPCAWNRPMRDISCL